MEFELARIVSIADFGNLEVPSLAVMGEKKSPSAAGRIFCPAMIAAIGTPAAPNGINTIICSASRTKMI